MNGVKWLMNIEHSAYHLLCKRYAVAWNKSDIIAFKFQHFGNNFVSLLVNFSGKIHLHDETKLRSSNFRIIRNTPFIDYRKSKLQPQHLLRVDFCFAAININSLNRIEEAVKMILCVRVFLLCYNEKKWTII